MSLRDKLLYHGIRWLPWYTTIIGISIGYLLTAHELRLTPLTHGINDSNFVVVIMINLGLNMLFGLPMLFIPAIYTIALGAIGCIIGLVLRKYLIQKSFYRKLKRNIKGI